MALQPQTMTMPFVAGADSKSDPKQLPLGKNTVLQNSRLNRTGSSTKRFGRTSRTTTTDIGTINSSLYLATYKNELLQADGGNLYSYDSATDKWFNKGAYNPVTPKLNSIIANPGAFYADSCFHPSGRFAYVWTDTAASPANVFLSIYDQTTGEITVNQHFLTNGSAWPSVHAIGNFIVVILFSVSEFVYYPINVNTLPTIASPVLLVNDVGASQVLAATTFNNSLYIAYDSTSSGGQIGLLQYNSSLSLVNSGALSGESCADGVTVFGDDLNNFWIAYNNGTNVKAAARTSTISGSVLTPTVLTAFPSTTANLTGYGTGTSPSVAHIYGTVPGSGHSNNDKIQSQTVDTTGSLGASKITMRSMSVASRVGRFSGRAYMLGTYQDDATPTNNAHFLLFLNQDANSNVAARFADGFALNKLVNFAQTLPKLNNCGTFLESVYSQMIQPIPSPTGIVYGTGISSSKLYPSTSAVMCSEEIANNLYLSGGYLYNYDGASLTEQGFHVTPPILTGTYSTSGGSMGLASGTFSYSFVAVYSWVDNQGQIQRSAPSLPFTLSGLSGGASGSATITAKTLRISAKTNVVLELYSTVANGTIYYLNQAPNNDPTTDTHVFTLIQSDANLQANLQLYTNGGEVDNSPGPPPLAMTTYKSRLIVIPSTDPQKWWFSKQVIPGSPIEMSEFFVQNEDQFGGDLTAAKGMDDKLILGKQNHLFVTTGTGPAPNGTSNDFTTTRIASDGGMVDQRSVVSSPLGIFYGSNKGIYLLDRSLTTQYIGKDVEGFNGQSINAATLIDIAYQVRFILGSGSALVFDYNAMQWYEDTNNSGVAAVSYQNIYNFLNANGVVSVENLNAFTDNGSFITRKVTTGWITFAGVQGYQRLWEFLILGDFVNSHNLVVQIAYDFGSVSQTDTIAVTTTPSIYQYRIRPNQQKFEAIQITISDTQNGAAGESFKLSALAFKLGIKQGLKKIAAANTYG